MGCPTRNVSDILNRIRKYSLIELIKYLKRRIVIYRSKCYENGHLKVTTQTKFTTTYGTKDTVIYLNFLSISMKRIVFTRYHQIVKV